MDVLWWTRSDDALVEIAKIMNLPEVSMKTPGWLNHKSWAIKNVLDAMTDKEKVKFDAEIERYKLEGLLSDIQ